MVTGSVNYTTNSLNCLIYFSVRICDIKQPSEYPSYPVQRPLNAFESPLNIASAYNDDAACLLVSVCSC